MRFGRYAGTFRPPALTGQRLVKTLKNCLSFKTVVTPVPSRFQPRTAMQTKAYPSMFAREFRQVKNEHGSGLYSYAEGMTRRAARRIARKRSRMLLRSKRAMAVAQ